MATLVIKSFPEMLHNRLKRTAAAHRRSVTQETILLIEAALVSESALSEERALAGDSPTIAVPSGSYWATRTLIPAFQAALDAGAFSGGTDSTQSISEERDAR